MIKQYRFSSIGLCCDRPWHGGSSQSASLFHPDHESGSDPSFQAEVEKPATVCG